LVIQYNIKGRKIKIKIVNGWQISNKFLKCPGLRRTFQKLLKTEEFSMEELVAYCRNPRKVSPSQPFARLPSNLPVHSSSKKRPRNDSLDDSEGIQTPTSSPFL
jgi:hypothetical protein